MDKRIWINIGLLVFIVLLSAIALYPADEAKQALRHLTDVDSDSITRIEITRKDLDDFIFTKEGDTWRMDSPLQYIANNARINAMLRILNTESHSQLNPAELDLARFDLINPAIILKLNDYAFKFGNTDAIDQRRYILFSDTIHLTNDSLYAQLTTNAAFYANTKLLPEGIEIDSIQFPDNQIKQADDRWQMQSPIDMKPEQLKQLAFNWTNSQAISVSKYLKPEVEPSITVTSKDNYTIKFIIVATKPHLILGRKDIGIQYHMGSDEAEKLILREVPTTATTLETNTLE